MTPETYTSVLGWLAALLVCIVLAMIVWVGIEPKRKPIVHIPAGTVFNDSQGMHIRLDAKGRVICSSEKE